MGFITLHIVNATLNQRADKLILSLQMIGEIIELVQEHFCVQLDQKSVFYERFLRHLQFFAKRILYDNDKQLAEMPILHLNWEEYPEAVECVEKIGDHILNAYQKKVTDSEKCYLIYHIITLISDGQIKNMKQKIKASLEAFSKSIVQPLMYLGVAGTVLILGILLTNTAITEKLTFLQAAPFQLIGKLILQHTDSGQ